MLLTGENRRIRRKTNPDDTPSTTNPTLNILAQNPDLRGDRPATNRLSYAGPNAQHINNIPSEISSYHSGEYEAQNLLGCTAVFLIECRPTFQRCVLPSPSGQSSLKCLSTFI
jgi:hypothetical protein